MKPELWIPLMSFGGTLAILVVASIYNNSRLTDLQKFVMTFMTELLRAESASMKPTSDASRSYCCTSSPTWTTG